MTCFKRISLATMRKIGCKQQGWEKGHQFEAIAVAQEQCDSCLDRDGSSGDG